MPKIKGSNQKDRLYGSHQKDTILALAGNDVILAYGGNDIVKGGDGKDIIKGGKGKDKLYGGNQNDKIYGDKHNDKLYGQKHNDKLFGGKHTDRLYGGQHNDKLYGGKHNDWLYGGTHHDLLYGGTHNDTLYGESGDDRLYGQEHHDFLDGGSGVDRVYGGSGHDRVRFNIKENASNRSDEIIDGGTGSDTLELVNASRLSSQQKEALAMSLNAFFANGRDIDSAFSFSKQHNSLKLNINGIEKIKLNGTLLNKNNIYKTLTLDTNLANDTFTVVENVPTQSFDGREGDDELILSFNYFIAGENQYRFDGGSENDSIHFTDYADLSNLDKVNFLQALLKVMNKQSHTISMYQANLNFSSVEAFYIDGVLQKDANMVFAELSKLPHIVYGSNHDDLLSGYEADDSVYGLAGDDRILGDEGDDELYGHEGDDELYGNEGNDFLYGGAGDDKLDGGLGDDVLHGGSGHDTLTDTEGHNIFIYEIDSNRGVDAWNRYEGSAGDVIRFTMKGDSMTAEEAQKLVELFRQFKEAASLVSDGEEFKFEWGASTDDDFINLTTYNINKLEVTIPDFSGEPDGSIGPVEATVDVNEDGTNAISVIADDGKWQQGEESLTLVGSPNYNHANFSYNESSGEITIDTTGLYDYIPGGETRTDHIVIERQTGETIKTYNIALNIVGSNDAPVGESVIRTVDEGLSHYVNLYADDIDNPRTDLSIVLYNEQGQELIFNAEGKLLDDNNQRYSDDHIYSTISMEANNVLKIDGSASYYETLNIRDVASLNLKYKVRDNTPSDNGESDFYDIEFFVNGKNNAPSAMNINLSIDEDTPSVSGNIMIEDVDDIVDGTYSHHQIIFAQPDKGVVKLTDYNEFTYYLGDNFQSLAEGVDEEVTFAYWVIDAHGGISPKHQINIKVIGVDETPVWTIDDSYFVREDTQFVVDLTAYDNDIGEGALDYQIAYGADKDFFIIEGNALKFINALDYENPLDNSTSNNAGGNNEYLVTVQVSDGDHIVYKDLTVIVTDGNESPVITTANVLSVDENETYVATIESTDDEQDHVTYTLKQDDNLDGDKFDINADTGVLTLREPIDYEAIVSHDINDFRYNIVVEAKDQYSPVSSQFFTILFNEVPEAPTVTSTTLTIDEKQITVNGFLTAVDALGENDEIVEYRIVGGADSDAIASINNLGQITFKKAPDKELPQDSNRDGVYDIIVVAEDTRGSISEPQAISISVNNIDEPMVVNTSERILTLSKDRYELFSIEAYDVDGYTINYTIDSVEHGFADLFTITTEGMLRIRDELFAGEDGASYYAQYLSLLSRIDAPRITIKVDSGIEEEIVSVRVHPVDNQIEAVNGFIPMLEDVEFNSFAAGDFNKDGLDDFVVVSGTGINFNLDAGTYVNFYVADNFITHKDINADGYSDILSFGPDMTRIFFGHDDFSPQHVFYYFSVAGQDALAALIDINGDGFSELFRTVDNNKIHFNTFTDMGVYELYAPKDMNPLPEQVLMLNIGDFNGDGYEDLMFNNGIFLGGPYSLDVMKGLAAISARGDVTNSNHPDLVTIYNQVFLPVTGSINATPFGQVKSLGDINGDGKDDIYVHNSDANQSGVFLGRDIDANNSYLEMSKADIVLTGQPEKLNAIGDINGDGYDDMLFATDTPLGSPGYIIYGAADIDITFSLNKDNKLPVGFTNMATPFALTDKESYVHSEKLGDVNGDGFDDFKYIMQVTDDNASSDFKTVLLYGYDNLNIVTHLGNEGYIPGGNNEADYGNNVMHGSIGDDVMFAKAGDDILYGHQGADRFNGGAGDDVFYIDADDVSINTGNRIDGGHGYDELHLALDQDLDLTALHKNTITSIEGIDLSVAGENTLTLALGDLIALVENSNPHIHNPTGTDVNELLIKGDAEDTLQLVRQTDWVQFVEVNMGSEIAHTFSHEDNDYHIYHAFNTEDTKTSLVAVDTDINIEFILDDPMI